MRVTGDSYAQDVQDHKRQGDIGKHAVQFADDRLLPLGPLPFNGATASFAFLGADCRRNACAIGREQPLAALAVGNDAGCDGSGEA